MRTRWKFALLYFSEGAPIGFLWWAMPTLLRNEGVALERIAALTAALALPWTLKFLWAPLVDAWRGPRWGLRHWAATAQIGMGVALVPLVFIDPSTHFGLWFGLLLTHAVCAATQDVAIDALAVATVEDAERGRLNAAMQIGMLGGRSVFGGGAILLVGWGGWPVLLIALVGAVWISLFVLWTQIEEPKIDGGTGEPRSFYRTLRQVLARRTTWLGLGFALTAGAGFEATGALAGPLLIDLGASTQTTGWFFALPVVVTMAVGGWFGGRWSDNGVRTRRAALALIGMTIAVGAVALSAAVSLSVAAIIVSLAILYVGIGAFTAISYALFMDLTDKRLGATQFSTFMAATNGCEVWAVALGGFLVGRMGYGPGFGIMAAAGLVGLVFLRVIGRSDEGAPDASAKKSRTDQGVSTEGKAVAVTQRVRPCHELGGTSDIEFGEERLTVFVRGGAGDAKSCGHLCVGHALGDEFEHLGLPGREVVAVKIGTTERVLPSCHKLRTEIPPTP